jgi:hypothetical protein
MVRITKYAFVALAFAPAAGLASLALAAGPTTSPLPESARGLQTAPASAALPHTVKNLYESWNKGLVETLPASTYTAVDSLSKIKCVPLAGCTVIAQTNAQIAALTDGTQWAICTQVDGAWSNPGCYYQGIINIADGARKGNDRQNWHVATGTHTVQTFIYPTHVVTLSEYQNDYLVVTP